MVLTDDFSGIIHSSQDERPRPVSRAGGPAGPGGPGGPGGRRKKQNRRIPGKSTRPGYTQASAHVREDLYDHVVTIIRGDSRVRDMLQRQCIELGVEPGGGKPRYGYSELVEMLLVRWAGEEEDQPAPR